jgi:hypothetical protein
MLCASDNTAMTKLFPRRDRLQRRAGIYPSGAALNMREIVANASQLQKNPRRLAIRRHLAAPSCALFRLLP